MKRSKTADLDSVSGSGILTSERIGQKRSRTPEGFLLCEDVPIARTGHMIYMDRETPIRAGPMGYAMIVRDAATLFDQRTVASFNGKPVTNNHPPLGVDPDNWTKFAVGSVMNCRQGTGDQHDVMLADLLITDKRAIADVESGKKEVSAGYDADYEATGVGEGRQLNIIGNHVALVERGRCGPRCAIGDREPTTTEGKATMPMNKARRRVTISPELQERLADAIGESLGSVLSEGQDGATNDGAPAASDSHVHIHMHPTHPTADADETPPRDEDEDDGEKRMKKVEDTLDKVVKTLDSISKQLATRDADETPPKDDEDDGDEDDGDEDDEKKKDEEAMTQDSRALKSSFQALLADAEVLVPGFKVPTFDAKAKRRATMDTMCALRKRVLDTAFATAQGHKIISTITGAATLDTAALPCTEAASLFRSAAGAQRLLNNQPGPGMTTDAPKGPKKVTLADLNAMHRAAYKH